MEVTTRASSPLSDNTTLRILAFRRVGQSPDLQADEYMGEGTYRASSGNGSLTPVHSLLLRAGSYDFYALTPETATASGGGGGSGIPGGGGGTTAPPYTVSVGHGMDYATSLTEGRAVDESNPSVPLNDLVRRCTRLVFELSPKAGNIKSVSVVSAGLTDMTKAPRCSAPACRASPYGSGAERRPHDSRRQPPPDRDLNTSAAAVVLPPAWQVSSISSWMCRSTVWLPQSLRLPCRRCSYLLPGTQYTFTLKMKGSSMQLTLTVVPWG